MFERILVPVDGSDTARKGLGEAIALARLTGGRLRLMYVAPDPLRGLDAAAGPSARGNSVETARLAARALLAAEAAIVRAAGLPVDDVLFETSDVRLSDRVVEAATEWKADVVVIGSHGRRGVRRLVLGSDAEQILRVSPVPVLLVRADAPHGTS